MVDKPGAFMASRPTVVEQRHTLKAYQAAYAVIDELSRKDAEAVVELLIRDDKSMLKDIATWCTTTGYQLICSEPGDDGEMRCLIQKGERKRNDKVMTVVISTADLEQVAYPFDRALGGAVLGMTVNVVFEGTGVRLLKRGYRASASGFWGRMFTAVLETAMKDKIGWPLPHEAITMLEELGANFYVCGPSLVGYGVREEDLVVKSHTLGGTVTLVDLLARSNVNVFSKAVFEKP
jgi:predicted peroxiredoxin/TusA-related sulfurtransferase